MCKIKVDYNDKLIEDLYYYDPSSPSGLRHKIDNKSKNPTQKRYKNDPAGCIRKNTKSTIWVVKINGVALVAHRVVWKLVHGIISDSMVIDHLDGNQLNNSIENLRLVTQAVNNRNHKKQINNDSGETGVRLEGNRWRVQWNDPITGSQKSKSFNISKYGNSAFDLAVEFRRNIISTNYTSRHGK
jgi:hypothetical protein